MVILKILILICIVAFAFCFTYNIYTIISFIKECSIDSEDKKPD